MTGDRYLRFPEVRRRVGLCRTTIDKLERAGRFPKRHRLTDYAVGWRESEVDAYVAGRREWSSPAAPLAGALPPDDAAALRAFGSRSPAT